MELSPLTCTAEQLFSVVSGHNRSWLLLSLSNPVMNEDHVTALLRNPLVTPEIVQHVYDRFDWSSSLKVQFSIVNCPKTPYTLAIRLLPNLFWNDLMKTVVNYRITPRLRRIAENYLREKITNLTLGEKISLARRAPRPAISILRQADEKEVITALLQNPNLVEDDVVAMVQGEFTPPEVLEAVATNRKWTMRYSIRLALVKNAKTPLRHSLAHLSKLRKQDLQAITRSPQTAELLRRAADRILSGNY